MRILSKWTIILLILLLMGSGWSYYKWQKPKRIEAEQQLQTEYKKYKRHKSVAERFSKSIESSELNIDEDNKNYKNFRFSSETSHFDFRLKLYDALNEKIKDIGLEEFKLIETSEQVGSPRSQNLPKIHKTYATEYYFSIEGEASYGQVVAFILKKLPDLPVAVTRIKKDKEKFKINFVVWRIEQDGAN